MSTNILLVPIHLDAIYLDAPTQVISPTAHFSKLPYKKNNREKINENNPNVSESVLAQPFEKEFTLNSGVHLHWSLPKALIKGVQKRDENGNTYTDYPAVPNRWLIIRTNAQTQAKKRWIVESDYLHPEGQNNAYASITYPIDLNDPDKPAGSTTQPFRYMGRCREYDASWATDSTAEYLSNTKKLTPIGYGEISFAAFYPNCHSVFGFHDTDGHKDQHDYEVLGWYNKAAHDPLTHINTRAEILQHFNWQVVADETNTAIPGRTVCVGGVKTIPDSIEIIIM